MFYNINLLNNSFIIKENLIFKVLYALNIIERKVFYNYDHLSDLFDISPFKYIKILYHEINVSHPEFIYYQKMLKEKCLQFL